MQENKKRKGLGQRMKFRYVSDASTFCGGKNIFSQHVTCERSSTSVKLTCEQTSNLRYFIHLKLISRLIFSPSHSVLSRR